MSSSNSREVVEVKVVMHMCESLAEVASLEDACEWKWVGMQVCGLR